MTNADAAGPTAGFVVPSNEESSGNLGRLDVLAVPAGWWIRVSGAAVNGGVAEGPDDPVFAALPDPEGALTLVVGAPGSPTPGASEVGALIAALPDDRRDDVVVSIHGSGPAGEPSLAQRLADLTGRPILAQHGLLLAAADSDGEPRVVAFDVGGGPPWRPFAPYSFHSPGMLPTVERWHVPPPGLDALGGGDYRLVADWFVRVIPAGLVLSSTAAPVSQAVAGAPFDPSRLDLVVDRPVAELSDAALAALGRFADMLPGPARSRLRVVLPHGTGDAEALRVRWAVPAPQIVQAVDPVDPVDPVDAVDPVEEVNFPRPPATVLAVTARGQMRLVGRRGPAVGSRCG